jgi:HEAT repeat protein
MSSAEQICKILQSGTKEQKKRALESVYQTANSQIINEIVSRLDDTDIEIRGEAFSALLLNECDISDILIKNLKHQSRNIRAYSALVLANRNSQEAIPEIISLVDDQSAMVRSCAVGALGYLKARTAITAIAKCLADSNIEVKKSAIKSAIDVGGADLLKEMDLDNEDPEIRQMLKSTNKMNGPGGI